MFCRFCGRQLPEDSVFCQYCGKNQSPSGRTTEIVPPIKNKREKNPKVYTKALSIISSILFFVGIIAFLIFNIKMSPGFGTYKLISYAVGASVTIIVAIIVYKISKKLKPNTGRILALVFGLLLLIPSVSLRIIYEAKVDHATKYIPRSGNVSVEISLDKEYYSYEKEEAEILNPFAYIVVNDKRYDDGEILNIKLNKIYGIAFIAGYSKVIEANGDTGYSNSGKTTESFALPSSTLGHCRSSYTRMFTVNLDRNEYCDVDITFKRVCHFWDVIFADTDSSQNSCNEINTVIQKAEKTKPKSSIFDEVIASANALKEKQESK